LEPGEYFPHQSIAPDAARIFAESNGEFSGAGAGMNPRAEQFNTGTLLSRGDIDLSVRPIISALRSAVDARERTRVASGIVERFAVRDQNGRLLEGEEPVKAFVDSSNGLYQSITGRQLASITSLSMDTAEGQALRRLLDESLGSDANKVYAIPAAVMRGWNDVLKPAGRGGKIIDQIYSLWKGGVLALSPRWYFQNFVGMWGQFALGAGADLQAITMARNPAYADTIPGRIAQSGLADDLGEYARQAGGISSNPFGRIMRGGFSLNSLLEGVPRKAMFWASTKRSLAENNFLRRDTMDEGGLAQAWLDVAQAPQKFGKIAAAARRRADVATDPAIKARYLEQARVADLNAKGANAIIDDAINVTERFMGNYSRYNPLEKKILKRVFPFYGWMRAIHRLAFALPVKHPKRAALLASAIVVDLALPSRRSSVLANSLVFLVKGTPLLSLWAAGMGVMAAGTLGASRPWVFVTVTLPLILPGIVAGAILGFAKAMGEFGATITFVANIPGQTQTLPSAIYAYLQVPGGYAAAFRLVLVAIAIAMLALLLSEWVGRSVARRIAGA
jgi:hypothetical protein